LNIYIAGLYWLKKTPKFPKIFMLIFCCVKPHLEMGHTYGITEVQTLYDCGSGINIAFKIFPHHFQNFSVRKMIFFNGL